MIIKTFELNGQIIDEKTAAENKDKILLVVPGHIIADLQAALDKYTPNDETTRIHTLADGNIRIFFSPNFDKAGYSLVIWS